MISVADDHRMSTANSSRITLEIVAGADPIRGSIELHDGTRQAFWGWLELIEELRRAAADTPERAPPDRSTRAMGRHSSSTRQVKPQQPDTTTEESS
jgi:hypothetical protein